MIDLTKLEWGLRPFRELEALAVYGARTIFRDGNIEFLVIVPNFVKHICNFQRR